MKHVIVKAAASEDITNLLKLYDQDDFDDHLIESVTVQLKLNEPIRINITRFVQDGESFEGRGR